MRAIALFIVLASFCGIARAQEPLITIDVHDASISDVIGLLAAESGKNIVLDGSIKSEHITLHLHDVSFEDALRVLASSYGLQVRRESNVMIVGEAESMNRRYDDANSQLGAQTVVLNLLHAKPDDVSKELSDALPTGTVILADKRTSEIVVTGDADTVARARHIAAALDAPTTGGANGVVTASYHLRFIQADEALKELKVLNPDGIYIADDQHNAVVVSGNDALQSSVQGLFETIDRASPQVLFEVKVADVTPQNNDSNIGLEWGGANLQGLPTLGATTYAFTGASIPVNVTLNALISEGRAQILATPRLFTINNKEADLLIGETYPIVFNTSVLGGQNVQFVDIGVKLRLTPTIGPDGIVTAELHPEYSELLGLTDTGYPIIANRKIDSTLRVGDSQTIVLGGLLRDVDTQTVTKVPGLSAVPFLGKLFQNKQSHHERDEIVFLITPHVIFPDKQSPSR